jgi:ATP-binding cassette, subfamily B, bacterial
MTGLAGVFRDALRADPRLALSVAAMRVAAAVLAPLDAVALGLLVNAAVSRDAAAALGWAAVFAVADAGSSALNHPAGKLELTLREKTDFTFAQRLLRLSTAPATLGHLEQPGYHDRIVLARDRSSSMGDLVVRVIALAQAAMTMAVVLAALATVNPVLTVLAAAAVPTMYLTGRAEVTRYRRDQARAGSLRLADRLFEVATQAGPVKEVKVSGAEAALRSRFTNASAQACEVIDGAELRAVTLTAAGWLVFAAAFMAAIVLVARQAEAGHASPGQVLMVVALAIQINGQVQDVTGAMSGTRRAVLAARRLLWLYRTAGAAPEQTTAVEPAAEESAPGETAGPAPVLDGNPAAGAIELDDVSFRYPGTGRDVLRGVSLRLEPGSTVAVVGDNGAGKTTLIKLLCGLYAPTGGRITVDGRDLRGISPVAWRRRLSGSFQDFVRFELALRESAGVGLVWRMDDDDLVRAAIDSGGARPLAEGLPHGLGTQLGPGWPDGVDLSGGQWQKVALSRAMMRRHPHLLMLDEPTASMDAAAEHALYEKFSRATESGRQTSTITVLVSHRFATVQMADMIVVLDEGQVKETGSHQTLLQLGGTYAELFELQARGYR